MKFWLGVVVFFAGLVLVAVGLYMLHPAALVAACGCGLLALSSGIVE